MSVYVDDMQWPFRGMVMSHLIADTHEELLGMVDRIGVQRKWIQYPGTDREHFDICQTKRKRAIFFGAIEITWRDYAARIDARQGLAPLCGKPIPGWPELTCHAPGLHTGECWASR